jgi:four helix bundle protein
MKMRVARFEELEVRRTAFALQERLFELSKQWPREEQYALTDQIRRASRSIGANIAEAWAKRRYEAHFVSKLTDADGELDETRHWLLTARACSYLGEDVFEELKIACDEIERKLGRMIVDAHLWVQSVRPSYRPPV